MSLWFIVAIVVAIPIVLVPVALIWYINVSGLAQVMKDARVRQKAKAKLVREIE